MSYIKLPKQDMTDAEKWVFFKMVEAEAKKALDELKEKALGDVHQKHNDFYDTEFGKAQWITKTDRRVKYSMKEYLYENGYLELCQKDDIDLAKVKELVDAGLLKEEEVEAHIDNRKTAYLKYKK